MPRYFLHIGDQEEAVDPHGIVFASPDEARSYAVLVAGELIRDLGRKLWSGGKWRLHVTDEAGEAVCTIRFIIEDGSAS
ncbi:DUF6894 family protein [Microvirga sp. M2]|uniref:DUF6894 family protein n=1 Tax=Microvirga sp. M2 TaxID=3073270 RepID=UPI0039C36CBA